MFTRWSVNQKLRRPGPKNTVKLDSREVHWFLDNSVSPAQEFIGREGHITYSYTSRLLPPQTPSATIPPAPSFLELPSPPQLEAHTQPPTLHITSSVRWTTISSIRARHPKSEKAPTPWQYPSISKLETHRCHRHCQRHRHRHRCFYR